MEINIYDSTKYSKSQVVEYAKELHIDNENLKRDVLKQQAVIKELEDGLAEAKKSGIELSKILINALTSTEEGKNYLRDTLMNLLNLSLENLIIDTVDKNYYGLKPNYGNPGY